MKKRKLYKRWKRQRKQAQEKLRFDYVDDSCIPGTKQLIGFISDCPFPIGTVWYCCSGLKQIQILHSYVIRWARRIGVRTALHREMIRAYPGFSITTGEANKRSRPWLKKQGFKLKRRGWVLKSP